MPKTGLVLSGGGVRGFAHLGLLQVLDECGVRPTAISGVSAGAIVGALYAAGHSPKEILRIMKANSYFGWSNFLFKGNGFFSLAPLQEALQKQIPADSFEALRIRLFVTVTDLLFNRSMVFSSGSLSKAVMASSSVPVIFEPVRIGDSLFVDGGLLNNFPLEPLEGICDLIIGCHTNKIKTGANANIRLSKAHIIDQSFHMSIQQQVYSKVEKCHIFIEPPLYPYTLFDVKKADDIYEAGYQHALLYKDQFIALADSA
jgi:NTE family protein